MIGELRDRETVELAINAAETGHLVLGTLHTSSAARTIDRILDVFPPDAQNQIRNMISESIKIIVCQRLLPRKDGQGQVLAMEILFNSSAIGNLIREHKLYQIAGQLQMGGKAGNLLLENHLMELVEKNLLAGDVAYLVAEDQERFAKWKPARLKEIEEAIHARNQ